MDATITDIASLIAVVVSVTSAIIAWRKAKPETLKLSEEIKKIAEEADTEECTAAELITKTALSLVEPLNKQITQLGIRLEEQEKRLVSQGETIETQGDEISALQKENSRLRKWAKRLFQQVVELGGVPIQFEEIESDG